MLETKYSIHSLDGRKVYIILRHNLQSLRRNTMTCPVITVSISVEIGTKYKHFNFMKSQNPFSEALHVLFGVIRNILFDLLSCEGEK